jgi:hypothetical protein
VDRQGLWTLASLIALLSLGIWRHIVTTEEFSGLQRALAEERSARQTQAQELGRQLEALGKKSQEEGARTRAAIDTVSKQAEAASGAANKSQGVLEVLYVIRYGPDGKPDAIAPRNDEAGIGLRR